jgi:hypothetical protein
MYKRMTAIKTPQAYVGVEQTTRKPMSKYTRRDDHQITALGALREIGLISTSTVAEFLFRGGARTGKAFTFFHDRYAEYEIAFVYGDSVLGSLSKARNRNAALVEQTADRIAALVRQSTAFPVLSGAIEHWFYLNLHEINSDDVLPLIPVCNALAAHVAGNARATASAVLTGFVRRGSVKPKELYKAVFSAGSAVLRIDMATALADSWPDVESGVARDFIESCDPITDELAIETLADAFAEHANRERTAPDGSSAIAFVAAVCPDLTTLIVRSLVAPLSKNHIKFLIRFAQIVIVSRRTLPAHHRLHHRPADGDRAVRCADRQTPRFLTRHFRAQLVRGLGRRRVLRRRERYVLH